MTPLSPGGVMAQIAQALPEACRPNGTIITGSPAAGFHFFAGHGRRPIRTKDVDCMISRHAKAVAAAEQMPGQLLAAAWQPGKEGAWRKPGNENTPENTLPMIRLKPLGLRGGAGWFIERLGAPDKDTEPAKTFHRVHTSKGHFAICSFNFLALAGWPPTETRHGLRIDWPEMMALANRLHHPRIAGAERRRSNQDLGRVLALASAEVGPAAFAATGRRFTPQVIEPLEEAAGGWWPLIRRGALAGAVGAAVADEGDAPGQCRHLRVSRPIRAAPPRCSPVARRGRRCVRG